MPARLSDAPPYKYCVDTAETAGYIQRWRPSSVSPAAAGFARAVVAAAGPGGQQRAKNLLWAAGKLADWGSGPAEPVPRSCCILGDLAVRRARPGCRSTRKLFADEPASLARGRPALAMLDLCLSLSAPGPYRGGVAGCSLWTRPTAGRRMRTAALVCLGAGAGLIRADLRHVRGTDIICRSGGVVAMVGGARPRAVPVLARYQPRLLAAAASAGDGLIAGGADRPGAT
jgi:hypothetical protein